VELNILWSILKTKPNPNPREKFFQIEEFLQQINEDIKTKLGNSDYVTSKQATLDYEVKNVKNIVCETEERCDKLDRALHQTMQNLSDLEAQMAMQQRIASVQNIRGIYLYLFDISVFSGYKKLIFITL